LFLREIKLHHLAQKIQRAILDLVYPSTFLIPGPEDYYFIPVFTIMQDIYSFISETNLVFRV
jgi:hypothetical protein